MQFRYKIVTIALCLLAVAVLVGGYAMVNRLGSIDTGTKKTECQTRELAGPWVALKRTIAAPVGDAQARADATKILTNAIDRLEHIDEVCP